MFSPTCGCLWTRTRASAPVSPGVPCEDVERGPKIPPPLKNYRNTYRYASLIFWLSVSALLVLDRFYWNVWPRQTICSQGCGVDFFCEMDDDPGCLKKGPWAAKAFDVIARVSARMIISTTSMMFLTMCHGTWNALSELDVLKPYLHNWREDNFWLHTIGGWTIGVLTIAHVWSLILPSIFHGYANRAIPGRINFPAQIPLGVPQIDVQNEVANWGYDDIWRIVWMTIIFGALMPLSRSMWALKRNFSLAMWLHMLAGAGFFIDSARRRTHPHVWILNLPFVIWYIVDKILCATVVRIDPCADAVRIKLDDEYMLLLWRHSRHPKMICDIFWVKRGFDFSDPARSGGEPRRTGELAHPFTTCSSHDVTVNSAYKSSASMGTVTDVRASIEAPIHTDVSWPGHRFTLTSILTPKPHCSSNQDGIRTPWNIGMRCTPSRMASRPFVRKKSSQSWYDSPSSTRSRARRVMSDLTPPSEDEEGTEGLSNDTNQGHLGESDGGDDREKDGTVIGIEVAGDPNSEMKMVLGKIEPGRPASTGCSAIADAVDNFFDDEDGNDTDGDDDDDCYTVMNDTTDKSSDSSASDPHRDPVPVPVPERKKIFASIAATRMVRRSSSRVGAKARTSTNDLSRPGRSRSASKGEQRKTMLVRMGTYKFKEYRQREMDEGRGGVLPGTWSKMAIVRVHRQPAPKVRECSCMGVTYTVTSSRRSETGRIADLEAAEHDETVPLRTYGPYRSAYGRLCEFPNLPPLLVVATGAGAALALDFVAYIRANSLVPIRPVTVCYSSSSLPLLQFVTNTLLAERTAGIEIKTALTRHDDLELFDTSEAEKELKMGRLDVEEIMASLPIDTEVYFCGGRAVNALLRKKCVDRGMAYTGSSVQ